MNAFFKRLVFSLTIIAVCGDVAARLEFVIDSGQIKQTPVAVVPFGWSSPGPVPYDVAQVIQDDLVRSGRFKAYPRKDMLEQPTAAHEVDYADWRLLGVEVIVIGQMRPQPDGNLLVGFQLFDAVRQQQLLSYNVTAPPAKLRSAGHYIADLIYKELLGEEGIFSTRIAYVTVTDTRAFELIVADADGENPKSVERSAEPIMSPAWSPDGKQLAYVKFEPGGAAIFVKNIFTGSSRRVSARPGVNGAPSWSPDGRQLSMTLSDRNGNLDIYVLNLATNQLTQLTRHSGIDTESVWSLDGNKLYFSSDRSGGPQIYELDIKGGKPMRLTFEGNYNARPRLSPKGDSLAVVHNDRGNYRIGILDLNSGGLRLVSDGRLDESPSYAPNGSVLIYASTQGRRGGLETVSSDGQIRQQLSSQGNDVREPVWSPFSK